MKKYQRENKRAITKLCKNRGWDVFWFEEDGSAEITLPARIKLRYSALDSMLNVPGTDIRFRASASGLENWIDRLWLKRRVLRTILDGQGL